MAWTEFERSVCRIATFLYRFDETELARAEGELMRLRRLAAHYRRMARGLPGAGEADSAAHLCSSPPPPRDPNA